MLLNCESWGLEVLSLYIAISEFIVFSCHFYFQGQNSQWKETFYKQLYQQSTLKAVLYSLPFQYIENAT